MSEDYYKLTESLGYNMVNHNSNNYDNFKDFSTSLDLNFEKVEKEKFLKERKRNIKVWDNSLPSRWRGAILKKINSECIPVIEEKIKKYPQGSFFIKGKPNSGKTFISYAIIRRYIYLGWVNPSQVNIITENKLLSFSRNGFQGQQKFDLLLDPKNKLFLFDSVGETETNYYDNKQLTFWEQIIDHIYSNQLIAIFTSTNSYSYFAEKLPDSTSSKLANLLEDKIIVVPESRPIPKINDYSDKDLEEADMIIDSNNDRKNYYSN